MLQWNLELSGLTAIPTPSGVRRRLKRNARRARRTDRWAAFSASMIAVAASVSRQNQTLVPSLFSSIARGPDGEAV